MYISFGQSSHVMGIELADNVLLRLDTGKESKQPPRAVGLTFVSFARMVEAHKESPVCRVALELASTSGRAMASSFSCRDDCARQRLFVGPPVAFSTVAPAAGTAGCVENRLNPIMSKQVTLIAPEAIDTQTERATNARHRNIANRTVDHPLEPVVSALRQALAPNLRAIVLFGSRARGDHQPESDWDLLVIADRLPERTFPRYLYLKRLLPDAWRGPFPSWPTHQPSSKRAYLPCSWILRWTESFCTIQIIM